MAGKKSPPDKRLTDNPFKQLKRLSVSKPPKSAEQEPPPQQAEPEEKPPGPSGEPGEDNQLFAREMEWLGVERRMEGEDGVPHRQKNPSSTRLAEPGNSDRDDDLLFQRAVCRLDKTFKEEATDVEPRRCSEPSRLRQLKRGGVKPEAQLDLHGLRREEALTRLGFFLENARHHGFDCVLIITGKGAQLTGGAVLRSAVLDWLAANREHLKEWVEAPRRYGGSGALVVFLR